jgi:hypothetical protein
MYIIIGVTTTIGGYVPVLFGADMLGGWSILGTLIGGIVGIYVFYKVRAAGYVE